jgi:hypothetical protein
LVMRVSVCWKNYIREHWERGAFRAVKEELTSML